MPLQSLPWVLTPRAVLERVFALHLSQAVGASASPRMPHASFHLGFPDLQSRLIPGL